MMIIIDVIIFSYIVPYMYGQYVYIYTLIHSTKKTIQRTLLTAHAGAIWTSYIASRDFTNSSGPGPACSLPTCTKRWFDCQPFAEGFAPEKCNDTVKNRKRSSMSGAAILQVCLMGSKICLDNEHPGKGHVSVTVYSFDIVQMYQQWRLLSDHLWDTSFWLKFHWI